MASSTVTLTYSSTSITINGPGGDQPLDPVPRYVMGMTQSGSRYVYKKNSAANRTWTLEFSFLTNSQKAALQSFFDNTVSGPTNLWTYTHTSGYSYTVRFAQTTLTWKRSLPNVWGVTLQLELVTGDVSA